MAEATYRIEDGELIENTAEDIAAIEQRKADEASYNLEENKNQVRQQRNALLAASDWTQANDSPLANDKKIEWASYRTLLRDLPSNKSWPDVTFPEEPS